MTTMPRRPDRQPRRLGEGRVGGLQLRVRDDPHDDGRAQHVDDRREAEADQGGQRDVALRVLDHAGGHRRALDAHVGPQRDRGRPRDRRARRSRRSRSSPRRNVAGSNQNQPKNAIARIGIRARLMVQVSSAPTTRGPRMLANVRSQMTPAVAKTLAGGRADRGDELREVAHRRHRDRDVADPVAEPVDVVGLETHVGPEEVPRVGVGPAFLRIQLPELGEDETRGRRHRRWRRASRRSRCRRPRRG